MTDSSHFMHSSECFIHHSQFAKIFIKSYLEASNGFWAYPGIMDHINANAKIQKLVLVGILVAMLDHFEIIKLLQSIIHRWKGVLLRYIMVSVVWLYVN